MPRKENGSDEQVELLRGIWDELKVLGKNLGGRIDQTNARLDETNVRLDKTNARIDQTNERLEAVRAELSDDFNQLHRVMTESDIRLATAVTDLAGDLGRLRKTLEFWNDMDRAKIIDLDSRVTRLEVQAGVGKP